MRIESLLNHGQKNAIPLRHLCNMTGIDERTIRSMIAAERMQGAPILSSSGYYLPANAEEKARFVRSMRHRANEILRAADAVEKADYFSYGDESKGLSRNEQRVFNRIKQDAEEGCTYA